MKRYKTSVREMERRVVVATFAFVLYLASFASKTSAACKRISYTSDACRSANYIKLDLPGDVKINKGSWWPTYKIIKLPNDMSEIYWYCGSSRERTAWYGGMANQLEITYQRDGRIHWAVYKCSCEVKDTTYDWCRSSNYIQVEGQAIYKNSRDKVINLPGLQSQIHWYCGNSRERTAWHQVNNNPFSNFKTEILANQLSITYSDNGKITWVIKRCY